MYLVKVYHHVRHFPVDSILSDDVDERNSTRLAHIFAVSSMKEKKRFGFQMVSELNGLEIRFRSNRIVLIIVPHPTIAR
jgi:hypothetical protein